MIHLTVKEKENAKYWYNTEGAFKRSIESKWYKEQKRKQILKDRLKWRQKLSTSLKIGK